MIYTMEILQNESEVIILPFLYRGKFPYTIPYAYALSISI